MLELPGNDTGTDFIGLGSGCDGPFGGEGGVAPFLEQFVQGCVGLKGFDSEVVGLNLLVFFTFHVGLEDVDIILPTVSPDVLHDVAEFVHHGEGEVVQSFVTQGYCDGGVVPVPE